MTNKEWLKKQDPNISLYDLRVINNINYKFPIFSYYTIEYSGDTVGVVARPLNEYEDDNPEPYNALIFWLSQEHTDYVQK